MTPSTASFRLIAREARTIVLMFGLAARTRHVRVETLARNVRSRVQQDVAGFLPADDMIVPNAPPVLALRVPAPSLVAAARAGGVSAALSRDAGRYLCNYLCWRASEAASAPRGPRFVAFIHVPNVRPGPALPSRRRLMPRTLGDLVGAGEAIMLAMLAAARGRR